MANTSYTANNKLLYSYNHGNASVDTKLLSSYAESLIFNGDNRVLWYKGRQFGNSYFGSNHGETFNDFEHNRASGAYSHAEGNHTYASGIASHAEGSYTRANNYSHAEGCESQAGGIYSHAEGHGTYAGGSVSHAEGGNTYAIGADSHAEGYGTYAGGEDSHAEGTWTKTSGNSSHAEGNSTLAGGMGFKVIACEKLTDTTGTYTLTSVTGLAKYQRY